MFLTSPLIEQAITLKTAPKTPNLRLLFDGAWAMVSAEGIEPSTY